MRIATSLGEGLFLKCDGCRETLYAKEVERNQRVCPKCGFHFRLSADERLKLLFDDGAFQPLFGDIRPTDPLKFRDTKRYRDRLQRVRGAHRPARRHRRRRTGRSRGARSSWRSSTTPSWGGRWARSSARC